MNITELSRFLAREVDRTSYRDVAQKIGISHGALEDIVKGKLTTFPKLETLMRIAQAYDRPLFEIERMAGIDLGLPSSDSDLARRLAAVVSRQPAWAPVLHQLMSTDPAEAGAILVYLEALAQIRR